MLAWFACVSVLTATPVGCEDGCVVRVVVEGALEPGDGWSADALAPLQARVADALAEVLLHERLRPHAPGEPALLTVRARLGKGPAVELRVEADEGQVYGVGQRPLARVKRRFAMTALSSALRAALAQALDDLRVRVAERGGAPRTLRVTVPISSLGPGARAHVRDVLLPCFRSLLDTRGLDRPVVDERHGFIEYAAPYRPGPSAPRDELPALVAAIRRALSPRGACKLEGTTLGALRARVDDDPLNDAVMVTLSR